MSGHSMEPALREGDYLFMLPPRRTARRGDVVLFRDPLEPSRLVLKRVVEVSDGALVVHSDLAGHTRDSRRYGPIASSDVIARAAFRYGPLSRFGLLPRG